MFYQELQFNAGLFGGKVDLVTGVNYFYEDASVGRRHAQPPRHEHLQSGDGHGPWRPVGTAGQRRRGIFRSGDTITEQKSNSFGWFNSATWHATDALNLTVGARLAHDKKDYRADALPVQRRRVRSPAPGTTSTTVTTDDSWTEVDWRGTLDYHFTKDLMGYATASKAYRAGQYSFTILPPLPGPAQSDDFIKAIPPEEVLNYELGAARHVLRRAAAPESRPCSHEVEQPPGRAPDQLHGRGPGRVPDRLPHHASSIRATSISRASSSIPSSR